MSLNLYENRLMFAFVVLLLGLWLGTPGYALDLDAITRPSADIDLSFVRAGKVSEILVKEGQTVQRDQPLARIENHVESAQYEIIAAKAGDTTRLKIAQAELRQKEKDLVKMRQAFKDGAITNWEVEHGANDATVARFLVKTASFDHEQDIRRQVELSEILKQGQLASPEDGVVEEIYIDRGEAVPALTPILRLVRIDPLRIDVHVPMEIALQLSASRKLIVHFQDNSSADARVEHISSVANAATKTLRVRIAVQNQHRRPAGEKVVVSIGGE